MRKFEHEGTEYPADTLVPFDDIGKKLSEFEELVAFCKQQCALAGCSGIGLARLADYYTSGQDVRAIIKNHIFIQTTKGSEATFSLPPQELIQDALEANEVDYWRSVVKRCLGSKAPTRKTVQRWMDDGIIVEKITGHIDKWLKTWCQESPTISS